MSVDYRPIPDYPDYRVGDDGTVWTRKRGFWCKRSLGGNTKGYLQLLLCRNGKLKSFKVHHLVLISFGFFRPSRKHIVRHLNGKRSDNRLSNLKWGTYKENEADKVNHGLSLQGERHHQSKLTEKDVHEIRYCFPKLNGGIVAAKFGVSKGTVNSIRRRQTWKHI